MNGDMKEHVLLVDDERNALVALRRKLRRNAGEWDIACAANADEAWRLIHNCPCDAVVTDVCMPGPSGLELLERIKCTEETRDVPVAIITGLEDRDLTRRALELGASELLHKPVRSDHLVGRLKSMLRAKTVLDELRASNVRLQQQVGLQFDALNHSRLSTMFRLAMAAELHDRCIGLHAIRVAYAARAVAEVLGLPLAAQEQLLLAAPLHDIGKIAIADRILLKPGPLSEGERAVMQRHCQYGEMILRQPTKQLAVGFGLDTKTAEILDDPALRMAAVIALTHHETFDGSGYPLGLSGTAIPMVARVVAVCDVYDALTSPRPYRLALSREEALVVMQRTAPRKFDPEVYGAFLAVLPDIDDFRRRFKERSGRGVPEEERIVEATVALGWSSVFLRDKQSDRVLEKP